MYVHVRACPVHICLLGAREPERDRFPNYNPRSHYHPRVSTIVQATLENVHPPSTPRPRRSEAAANNMFHLAISQLRCSEQQIRCSRRVDKTPSAGRGLTPILYSLGERYQDGERKHAADVAIVRCFRRRHKKECIVDESRHLCSSSASLSS